MAKKAYIGVPDTKNRTTLLLLHGDSISDSSGNGLAITNSNATVSTGQSVFGGRSLYFNGSSVLKVSAGTDFNFGSGDFAIECWCHPTSRQESHFFSGVASGATFFALDSSGRLGLGRSLIAWDHRTTNTVPLNTWTHVAVSKSNGVVRLFINGQMQVEAANSQDYTSPSGTACIGAENTGCYFPGYIQELRVSGVARWTSSFTPPSSPYSTAGETGGSVARKIKKGYVGVGDKARKIKKAYIGIGGVARPCWSGGELAYYGKITGLSVARKFLAGTSIGDYALFGGGYSNKSNVDAYNKSLVRSTATALNVGRTYLAATSVGNYALFGGGWNGGDNVNTLDAYDTSLTRNNNRTISTARRNLAATTIGDYALFGGGMTYYATNVVSAINSSLTYSSPNALYDNAYGLAATSVGDYAIFSGGYDTGTYKSATTAYDRSLTQKRPDALTVPMYNLVATSVGDYAIFSTGSTYSNYKAVVTAYDKSLTRSLPTTLSLVRHYIMATTLGENAIFAGGETGSSAAWHTTVDVYDASLTRKTFTSLSAKRAGGAAVTIGDYALFAGGLNGAAYDSVTDVVDVYTLA